MSEKKEISKFAKISLAFGLLGFLFGCCYGGVLGIVGLVYGVFVWLENQNGKKVALIGMLLSVCSIIATILMVSLGSSLVKSGQYDAYYEEIYEKMMQWGGQTSTPGTDRNLEAK